MECNVLNQKTTKETIEITLEDRSLEVEAGITVKELAERTDHADTVGATINGKQSDLRDEINNGDEVEFLSFEDEAGRAIFWHTSAHVLAQAVKMYFDDETVKLGTGPPVEEGFYYDFDLPRSLSKDELEHIENIMRQLIKQDLPLERIYRDKDKAIEALETRDETYKIELVEDLEEKPSFYRQDGFEDLCKGPHLESTGDIGAVALTKLSGSFWKGKETNPSMQRIYGISFPDRDQLERYQKRIREARKRDHRKLGRELDLFHIEDDIGPGLVVWHPRGSRIRQRIEDYWRDRHTERGYKLVNTPHLAKEDLWNISGHLDYYEENMFPSLDLAEKEATDKERKYRVKPMNCPFHMKIFKSDTRSYRDLPMRLAELGTVYRYEKSGVLHGLLRVRGFTQDDAHIFCREDQIESELVDILDFIREVLTTFGFDKYEVFVSTRPEKSVGSDERWELATNALRAALEEAGLGYEVDSGEGVFYGPKIDLKIRDSLNREWQCSTVQVDFNLPEQFEIEYVNEGGNPVRPIMIHRAIFGSLERFMGNLIEHYGGAFPPWLSPEPVRLLPVSDENEPYARSIAEELEKDGVTASITDPEETLGNRIRRAQSQKTPYTLIVGSDEEEQDTVEVREYGEDDSHAMDRASFRELVLSDIEDKRLIHETLDS